MRSERPRRAGAGRGDCGRRAALGRSTPGDKLLNARVDVGTIRMVEGELEVALEWPVGSGMVNDARLGDPNLVVPPGAVSRDRERVDCGAAGELSFAIESTWLASDGRVVRRKTWSAADERKRVWASGDGRAAYGSDPRSLVCMAVAAKCAGRPLVWPPPSNLAPLERSERDADARRVRGAVRSDLPLVAARVATVDRAAVARSGARIERSIAHHQET